jgi:uncharacterized protein (TIGR02271 family)
MTDTKEILSWRGQQLHDRDGEKVGKIEEIYLDAETEQPEWALVNTGLFGSKSTFVPLRDAGAEGDAVRVPYAKDQIKDAPRIDADGELSQREEAELYRHYGLQYSEARSDSGLAEGSARTSAPTTSGERADTTTADDRDVLRDRAGTSDAVRDAGGTSTSASGQRAADEDKTVRDDNAALAGDDADTDTAMTRSEEELRVGTRQRETGRARLRKYIVTEDVEETVPVRREEARVESEPITDDNVEQAMSGPDLSEAEHEVTLREEEPVAEKRTVPKERVRLDTDTVTDERDVSETVRKERVEIDDDSERRDG